MQSLEAPLPVPPTFPTHIDYYIYTAPDGAYEKLNSEKDDIAANRLGIKLPTEAEYNRFLELAKSRDGGVAKLIEQAALSTEVVETWAASVNLPKDDVFQMLFMEKYGLPKSRVIVVKNASSIQINMPFRKTNQLLYATIRPCVTADQSVGLVSDQILLQPQGTNDTKGPEISVKEGTAKTVPLGVPVNLAVTASDDSPLRSIYWDQDLHKDGADKNGDPEDDRDVVQNTFTYPDTQTDGPFVGTGPVLTLPAFTDADAGKTFTYKVFAEDVIGNISHEDVTVTPQKPEIFVDSFDIEKGILEGHIEPPRSDIPLRLLKISKASKADGTIENIVKELDSDTPVMTKPDGTFRITDLTAQPTLSFEVNGVKQTVVVPAGEQVQKQLQAVTSIEELIAKKSDASIVPYVVSANLQGLVLQPFPSRTPFTEQEGDLLMVDTSSQKTVFALRHVGIGIVLSPDVHIEYAAEGRKVMYKGVQVMIY